MSDVFSFEESPFVEECTYTVGTNDAKEFPAIRYVGTKFHNGKAMLCFSTTNGKEVTINPSYLSFAIKEKGVNNG